MSQVNDGELKAKVLAILDREQQRYFAEAESEGRYLDDEEKQKVGLLEIVKFEVQQL